MNDQREFSTGAVRDLSAGKGRYDLLPYHALVELAKHSERGSIHYGPHNIDRGIPLSSLTDSTFRHLTQFCMGVKTDGDNKNLPEYIHLVAACWNLMWALEFMVNKPEMNDLYGWKDEIHRETDK